MRAVFLGTGAGTPSRARNVASTALCFDDGAVWLVDCGEGTQHQILRSSLKPGRIEAILITHLHGDHCYGLPGLLASLAVHDRREPVTVVGPAGLREWLEVTLRVSALRLAYRFRVLEVVDGGALDLASGRAAVTALPLTHRLPSFAYHIAEPPRRGRIDAARAAALGLSGPQIGILAGGAAVTLADGHRVAPEAIRGGERPGRRVVLCGDSAGSEALDPIARDCDLLVHECTFAAGHEDRARAWGHSTAAMVGHLAERLRPRHLVLTHISSRYGDGAEDTARLRRECSDHCPGVPVTVATDFLDVPVPAADAPGDRVG